jgi:hypothetical protein
MQCRFTIITGPRFVMVLSEFGLRAKHQVIIWLSWSCPETSGQDYFFSLFYLTFLCSEFLFACSDTALPLDSLQLCSEQCFFLPYG